MRTLYSHSDLLLRNEWISAIGVPKTIAGSQSVKFGKGRWSLPPQVTFNRTLMTPPSREFIDCACLPCGGFPTACRLMADPQSHWKQKHTHWKITLWTLWCNNMAFPISNPSFGTLWPLIGDRFAHRDSLKQVSLAETPHLFCQPSSVAVSFIFRRIIESSSVPLPPTQ